MLENITWNIGQSEIKKKYSCKFLFWDKNAFLNSRRESKIFFIGTSFLFCFVLGFFLSQYHFLNLTIRRKNVSVTHDIVHESKIKSVTGKKRPIIKYCESLASWRSQGKKERRFETSCLNSLASRSSPWHQVSSLFSKTAVTFSLEIKTCQLFIFENRNCWKLSFYIEKYFCESASKLEDFSDKK